MNINSLFSVRATACALALTGVCTLTWSAQAANRPAKFAVASAQLAVMGIQTMPLQSQEESVQKTYPAQVVIPSNAEQVVSSPVSGLVLQLLVQQNQMVQAGTPLIRIASPELGQLQLQLLQANVRATLARQAAQREKDLFGEGLIAQRRVQEAQATLQESAASLAHAKTALRLSGMSTEAIDRIAASGIPQDSLVLSARQAGMVTDIKAKAGQRVDSTMPLVHLAQLGTLWLEIQVPVAESNSWAPGVKVKVPGREVTAKILDSNAMVASGSQTVMVRAQVDGKAGQVRPGELLSAELPATATAGGWDLPLSAVAHDGNQAFVFVRTPDGFEARPVKVSASSAQRVRVQGPVKAGEQVAVSGIVALKGAWQNEKEGK